MSRSFLTGLNLNKNELQNARIQNLSTPPGSPVSGQIYYDTDDNSLYFYNGTAWIMLAQGGDISSAIQAAIDALDTDDIEEGTTNLYYTDERAQDALSTAFSAGTHTGITITYTDASNKFDFSVANQFTGKTTDDLTEGTTNKYFSNELAQDAIGTAIAAGTQSGITVTYSDASNKIDFSVADQWTGKDTDDLTEGTTNLYFTNERAQDAVGGSVGNGLSYNDTSGAISVNLGASGGLEFSTGAVVVDRDVTDTWYDAAGAATTAENNAKAYADGLVQGLSVKDSVRAATSAAGTLATDFENGDTVGGVTLATGDRILIKNQSTASENGIYVVNATGAPTRAVDATPVASELEKGTYVLVTDGTYAATGWVVTAYSAGATTWTQFSAANEYTAGTNIAISSNQISFDGVLPIANGGTNANTAAGARTSLGATGKYAEDNSLLTPSSGTVTWTVTHNLGTLDTIVQVYTVTGGAQVEVDVAHTSTSVVTLQWPASSNVASGTYRVVVVG